MNDVLDRPLVSLCITCYNQARYIREAVQSAFDQTYDPLEIVICDDHSTDGTNKIVEEMVADYQAKGGRHTVIFKRNETNLYVMKNYEQAFRMAHGELLITGAGDDISMPNRAERIVEAWENDGRKAACIIHAWNAIDTAGCFLYKSEPWPLETIRGASATYTRNVVSEFSPLESDRTIYEDFIFSARAMMYGTALVLNDALIKYRVGSGETTNVDYIAQRKRVVHSTLRSCDIIDPEIDEKRKSISDERCAAVVRLQDWRRHRFCAESNLINGGTFVCRAKAFLSMRPEFGWNSGEFKNKVYLPLVFPTYLQPIAKKIICAYYLLKETCRKMIVGALTAIGLKNVIKRMLHR